MMILITLFQALCRFILLFAKILFTAVLAFAVVIVLLVLSCILADEDDE